ncbi:MAG: winged helix-turn-helix domain-containing protein, partial [Dokdonella sp.]|uniref:winged helix-turn-helix domain-containing protein n=1 Tax=Dokdonella sp. TaxID=2291710 RepID=UPI0032667D6E
MISSESGAAADRVRPIAYLFGPFRLDLRSRQLLRADDTPVVLTSKAFDTLLVLVEHAGEVLGKDALMSALWPGRVVEENNLNQKISTLRRALGAAGSPDRYIVTEPGRGYRFVAEVRAVHDRPTAAALAVDDVEAPSIAGVVDEQTVRRSASPPIEHVAQPIGAGGRVGLWLGTGAFVVVLAIVAWQMVNRRVHVDTGAVDSSATSTGNTSVLRTSNALLVLPLHVIGNVPDDASFAEGLGEELISVLARVDGLRVIARDSAFRARPANEDLAQTA